MRTRTILREAYRRQAKDWPETEQIFEFDEQGGYKTLTPTKGWKKVTGRRLAAQAIMMQRFGFVR